MEKINIAELLKDCPSGMEFDCTMFEGIEFDSIVDNDCFPILCRMKNSNDKYNFYSFTKYGYWNDDYRAKCVIFPKGKTTWEGFQRPFKDGDIVATESGEWIGIIRDTSYRGYFTYAAIYVDDGKLYTDGTFMFRRLATEEEKQKLFDAIKDNGYKWNAETKTLEKLEDVGTITIDDFKANTKEWLIDKLESMSMTDALQTINNIYDELHKPKYPKTFIEVLNFWHPDRQPEDNYQRWYKKALIEKFQDLLYARDTYWKIAGEEMRLGKPWKPDWTKDTEKYVIYPYQYLYSIDLENYRNTILAFPTAEMRDAFYENFKDLIEQCKEFL